jgi:phosphoglycerate kinase
MARDIARTEAMVEKSASLFLAIVGGADLENKIALIRHLYGKADSLFQGGAICFTFLRAKGVQIGGAPVDERLLPAAREILTEAEGHTKIVLPADFVAVSRASPLAETIAGTALLPAHVPMDIGHSSRRTLETLLVEACTFFWNRPLGVWEKRLTGMICGESLARGWPPFLAVRLQGFSRTAPFCGARR